MSKLMTVLATVLVVGTSTAAMASPSASVSAHLNVSTTAAWGWHRTPAPTPAPIVRDHRDNRFETQFRDHRGYDERIDYQPAPVHSWMLLGTVNQVVNAGTALDFSVGRPRVLSEIRLTSNGGKSRIMDVKINFANGTSKMIQLDRYVGQQGTVNIPASQSYSIAVNEDCAVRSITVDGLNATNSSYSIYAL